MLVKQTVIGAFVVGCGAVYAEKCATSKLAFARILSQASDGHDTMDDWDEARTIAEAEILLCDEKKGDVELKKRGLKKDLKERIEKTVGILSGLQDLDDVATVQTQIARRTKTQLEGIRETVQLLQSAINRYSPTLASEIMEYYSTLEDLNSRGDIESVSVLKTLKEEENSIEKASMDLFTSLTELRAARIASTEKIRELTTHEAQTSFTRFHEYSSNLNASKNIPDSSLNIKIRKLCKEMKRNEKLFNKGIKMEYGKNLEWLSNWRSSVAREMKEVYGLSIESSSDGSEEDEDGYVDNRPKRKKKQNRLFKKKRRSIGKVKKIRRMSDSISNLGKRFHKKRSKLIRSLHAYSFLQRSLVFRNFKLLSNFANDHLINFKKELDVLQRIMVHTREKDIRVLHRLRLQHQVSEEKRLEDCIARSENPVQRNTCELEHLKYTGKMQKKLEKMEKTAFDKIQSQMKELFDYSHSVFQHTFDGILETAENISGQLRDADFEKVMNMDSKNSEQRNKPIEIENIFEEWDSKGTNLRFPDNDRKDGKNDKIIPSVFFMLHLRDVLLQVIGMRTKMIERYLSMRRILSNLQFPIQGGIAEEESKRMKTEFETELILLAQAEEELLSINSVSQQIAERVGDTELDLRKRNNNPVDSCATETLEKSVAEESANLAYTGLTQPSLGYEEMESESVLAAEKATAQCEDDSNVDEIDLCIIL